MGGQIDLHIHTTASDGTDSPRQAVELAHGLGLRAVAITDHDTVAGIDEAMAAGAALGLEVVAGIEVSADYRGDEVHILGLFIDPASAALRPVLTWAVEARQTRNRRMVRALADDGFDISLEALEEEFPGAVLGRPHMAEHLVKKGCAASITEVFDRWLGQGRPYYRPREYMKMERAVQVIREAGGVAVLAHPLQYGYDRDGLETFVRRGREIGCAGLEVYYSTYGEKEQAMLQALADRYGLAVSGGSDYHGGRKPHIQMGSGVDGSLAVPYGVLEGLKERR